MLKLVLLLSAQFFSIISEQRQHMGSSRLSWYSRDGEASAEVSKQCLELERHMHDCL